MSPLNANSVAVTQRVSCFQLRATHRYFSTTHDGDYSRNGRTLTLAEEPLLVQHSDRVDTQNRGLDERVKRKRHAGNFFVPPLPQTRLP